MATISGARSTDVPSMAASSSMGSAFLANSHPFTCITCAIAFRSSESQRGHMRSDWHRYNLKRRVASLPPLSSEIFAEKVLSAQANSSAAAAKASFEKSCAACQKTYYSENAYRNHLNSQKHKQREGTMNDGGADDEMTSVMSSTVSLGDPLDLPLSEVHDPVAEAEFSEVVDKIKDTSLTDKEPVSRRPSRPHHSSNEDRPERSISKTSTENSTTGTETETPSGETNLKQCLFCNYESPSLKLSVMHMTKFHGMFIPEQAYLVDLEGLVGYLQSKIIEDHECLFCHKLKTSTSGIQTHMRDKGHCMIAFDTDEEMVEIGQYFDFRSTYSDDEDEDEDSDTSNEKDRDSAGAKLGARRAAFNSSNDSSMPDADGWETDSSASSLDSADLTAVPIDHDHSYDRLAHHRHHTHSDPRPHRNADGFHSHAHSHHAAFHSDHELHLPTGRTAGHRSLARYYRQNLHSYPTPAERVEQRLLAESAQEDEDGNDAAASSRQVATRANGGTGMIGVSDAKKREVAAVEKREQKRAHRIQQEYQWGNNKRANSQKHFRDPLLQ